MAGNDKTIQKEGAVVYLAGRNFIPNSDSPVYESASADADAYADEAKADLTILTE